MTMELTPKEARAIMDRRAEEAERNAPRIVGDVIQRDGDLTVTRYCGGHHPQFALYDGVQMVCLCVYKKGALSAMDYILKLRKGAVK